MLKGKRILAFVLMVVMLLSLLPAVALAEETTEVSIEGRTNLVTNGNFEFEKWSGSGWSYSSSKYGTKGTLVTEKYRGESGQSAKVGDQIAAGTDAGNKWISYSWDVGEGGLAVGNTYRFIVYAMKGDTDSNPKLEARGLNGSKNVGSETTADDAVTSSTDWVKLSVDLTVPETATKVTVYLRNNSATDGSYCYFDDFAVYDLSEKLYTVNWNNFDGTTLETDKNVAAGVTPEYNGATPTRPATGNYVYTFAGWSPEIAAVTGDVTYTAQYECGQVILSKDYEDGIAGQVITKDKGEYSADYSLSGGSLSAKVFGNYLITTLKVADNQVSAGHDYKFIVYSKKGSDDAVPRLEVRANRTIDGTSKALKLQDLGTEVADGWYKHVIEYKVEDDANNSTLTSFNIYLQNTTYADSTYCYFDDFAIIDLSAEAPAEKFKLNGANVNLGNDLDMKFFIKPTDLTEGETYTAKMVRTYADGSTDTQEETVSKVYSDGDYYVSYKGLAAKEMGDKIAVTIYDSEGNAVSQTWNDSIKDYVGRAMVTYAGNADTVAMLEDMLNYGAAAQIAFGYDANNLVNADLNKAVAEVDGTDVSVDNDRAYWNGAELRLESAITFKAFFKSDKVTRDMTAEVSFTNYKNAPVSYTVAGTAFGQDTNDTDLYVPVTGLVIGDTDTVITIVIKDAEGNEVVTVTDSIASYVVRYNSLANADADFVALNKAIMALGASVEAAL